jgi:2-oxo-4-hydroxy-4-carboxy-5-ureidoimidazoline decarboxylase
MNLETINAWNEAEACESFGRCCGSTRWSREMARRRPFKSGEALFEAADQLWWELAPSDWLEAFASHPKIGAREAPRPEHAATAAWSAGEQSGTERAGADVLEDLAELNRRYESQFGYIFIVCATGKTAEEMLAILKQRLSHCPEDEIKLAAAEQAKITRIRLEKLTP